MQVARAKHHIANIRNHRKPLRQMVVDGGQEDSRRDGLAGFRIPLWEREAARDGWLRAWRAWNLEESIAKVLEANRGVAV